MKKVFIDDYLILPLRQRMDELIDLNLDLESILSLLSNDLYGWDEKMLFEIKRYLKYLLWLKENNKDRTHAFAKYKKQTKQEEKPEEVIVSPPTVKDNSMNLENEFVLAQVRKERERIDEIIHMDFQKEVETVYPEDILAALSSSHKTIQNDETKKDSDQSVTNIETQNMIEEFNNEFDSQLDAIDKDYQEENETTFDRVLNSLTDVEIQNTLHEMIYDKPDDLEKKDSQSMTENEEAINDSETLDHENTTDTHLNSSLPSDDLGEYESQNFTDTNNLETQDTENQTTANEVEEMKTVEITSSPTNEAFKFLDKLEEQYGEQTVMSLATQMFDEEELTSMDFEDEEYWKENSLIDKDIE